MVEFYQLPLKERELKFVSSMLAVKMSIANLNIFEKQNIQNLLKRSGEIRNLNVYIKKQNKTYFNESLFYVPFILLVYLMII